jgi:hypothetical protein
MSTESVSSDSPLQVPQLFEDQLSEEELEMVAGGVLNELRNPTRHTPAGGGIGRIPIPNGALPTGPVGIEDIPDIYDTFTS